MRQGQRLRARPGPPLAAPHQRGQAGAVPAEEAALPGRARCQVAGGRRGLGRQGSLGQHQCQCTGVSDPFCFEICLFVLNTNHFLLSISKIISANFIQTYYFLVSLAFVIILTILQLATWARAATLLLPSLLHKVLPFFR